MKNLFKTKSQIALDSEIERLTELLSTISDPTEYAKTADNIKVLCEAREKKDPSVISTELLIGVGANLIGLLVILNFEKTGIITSKAFGWIGKK